MSKLEIVYGFHAVNALLETAPKSIVHLYVQAKREDERLQSLIKKAEKSNVTITRLSRRELDDLGDSKHQGVIAECKSFSHFDEKALPVILKNRETPALLLILDGVQDPHNLGACLRSANAFGVHAVIAPKDRAVGITPVVRKAACGAETTTPFIRVTNLSRTIGWLQKSGVWIVGTAVEAESPIQDIDLSGDIAIVLGSEGEGMRRLTKQRCDFLAQIPLRGDVESLNVSVAGGICLYEAQRQRTITEQNGTGS